MSNKCSSALMRTSPPPPIPNRYEKLYNLDCSTFSEL